VLDVGEVHEGPVELAARLEDAREYEEPLSGPPGRTPPVMVEVNPEQFGFLPYKPEIEVAVGRSSSLYQAAPQQRRIRLGSPLGPSQDFLYPEAVEHYRRHPNETSREINSGLVH
jgi:hypothetical protein